ncbi:hypothetical protein P7K49_000030 [Saguinus oedipus]|uniref:Laminin G domain-containing protein n=1 Tax=Saguinus oedipus TaxID=9490 RepID=A0ABQ9WC61_SAGOE|nr:hypothetical protein P7K49_000030 [Saguinus oedipus]
MGVAGSCEAHPGPAVSVWGGSRQALTTSRSLQLVVLAVERVALALMEIKVCDGQEHVVTVSLREGEATLAVDGTRGQSEVSAAQLQERLATLERHLQSPVLTFAGGLPGRRSLLRSHQVRGSRHAQLGHPRSSLDRLAFLVVNAEGTSVLRRSTGTLIGASIGLTQARGLTAAVSQQRDHQPLPRPAGCPPQPMGYTDQRAGWHLSKLGASLQRPEPGGWAERRMEANAGAGPGSPQLSADVPVTSAPVTAFYRGCMTLEVNRRLLDLDEAAYKHGDITSHSCPTVEPAAA